MAVVLPSDGSLLGKVLFFLSLPSFWLDDVIMTSLALLTDAVLMSLKLLAIAVGVAFIGLVGGVKLVFSTVSLNLTIFLPTQLPIQSRNRYPRNGISYISCWTSSLYS
jgi:hypothetical protein